MSTDTKTAAVSLAALLVLAAGAAAAAPADGFFADFAGASGLDFVHFNGMSGELYFPEMTGQGAALVDFDRDGDLDVYLVQGAMLGPGKTPEQALFPPPPGKPPLDRLYRNDLAFDAEGVPRLRFVDVTAASGLEASGYGMGVATGDYDNDGAVDLYVTNYGPNQLWRNNGDGTFRETTAEAGVGDGSWSTSASFTDLDGDGWLDLYVANYVTFDLAANPRCYAQSSRRDYCGPDAFEPQPDRLFRNRGDGSFEDVTFRALRGYEAGPGLGVTAADFDGDGRIDLYVANDGRANQLWINRGDGGFENDALLSGAALDREGRAEASMGADAADFDGDGDEDILLTHLMGETNTLYVNDGAGMFEDRSIESGLASASLPYTSFGAGWLDIDNDGWLDLLVVNGAVRILDAQAAAGEAYPLRQPNQLFRNRDGRFEEVTAAGGPAFALSEVSRGAAFGDVDNDGDTDALIANNSGAARLLLNQRGADRPWLGLRPLAAGWGRDLVGTRFAARRGDGPALWRRSRADGSYCSASDPRVLVGLGDRGPIERLEVHFPDGGRRDLRSPPGDRILTLVAGGGVDR